jgi:hypothetical protein
MFSMPLATGINLDCTMGSIPKRFCRYLHQVISINTFINDECLSIKSQTASKLAQAFERFVIEEKRYFDDIAGR